MHQRFAAGGEQARQVVPAVQEGPPVYPLVFRDRRESPARLLRAHLEEGAHTGAPPAATALLRRLRSG